MMENKRRQQRKGIGRFKNEEFYRKECLRLKSFRGVYFNNSSKKYPFRAQIQHKNVKYHLGSFKTIEEAALAYDQSATELFENKAILNKFGSQVTYVSFEKSIDERIRFYKTLIERLENIKTNVEANRKVSPEKKKEVEDLSPMLSVEAEMQKRYEELQERSSKNWFGSKK